MEQMSSHTYWADMRQFLKNCRVDSRLSPTTQLLFRTLVDLANDSYWAADFITTDADLMHITHITSKRQLNNAKNLLISLGYIRCHGKPNKFTVYRPRDLNGRLPGVLSGYPQTPKLKTNTQIQYSEKETEQRKKAPADESHTDNYQQPADSATSECTTTTATNWQSFQNIFDRFNR